MSEALQKQAVEFAWRQWTALGVAGVAPPFDQAIDLEALIAFTPFVASADPRLERECVDWCARVAQSFVSISRLRQIVRLMPSRVGEGAVDLSKLLIEKPLGRGAPVKLSGKSRRPRLGQPSLLQLRCRYVFGVGARADVIAALVMLPHGRGAVRISAIRPAGYTKQAVATVMDELAEAGVLEKLVARRTVSYKVLSGGPLRSLLAPLPRHAPRWPERFALVASILETWRRFGSRATYTIEIAKVLDQLSPLAATIGEKPPIIGRPKAILGQIERWSYALLEA